VGPGIASPPLLHGLMKVLSIGKCRFTRPRRRTPFAAFPELATIHTLPRLKLGNPEQFSNGRLELGLGQNERRELCSEITECIDG
jgi:hypothetical protein